MIAGRCGPMSDEESDHVSKNLEVHVNDIRIRVASGALALSLLALGCATSLSTSSPLPQPLPVSRANDNRVPAGTLTNGELKLRLVVRMARWYPEAPDGPYADVPAFAEEGRPPQIPAPLIRVPIGTTIVATVRNALTDSTIYLRGFLTRPTKALDSIPVRPGETRTVRFLAGDAGTYFYAATPGLWNYDKGGEREASSGALVVDPKGPQPPDRIFVINVWGDPIDSTDYTNALAINGYSWPYTERISATAGDTLRWRVINGSARNHPMHLHGFYFRVDRRGNGLSDSVYTTAQRRLAVTEDMSPGNTMYIVWSPDREGDWLFHCHIAFHVVPGGARLNQTGMHPATHSDERHSGDVRQHMAGLVLGINVRPAIGAQRVAREGVRRLHLYVDEGRRRGFAPRAFGYVLQNGDRVPAEDSVEIPGSVIVLTRGEPTDIIVVNRLRETTSVHWHGIELESYSDGVAGWSGIPDRLAPAIAPRDSFTARLTLPRAGTFIYHTHLNDVEQLTSGLYGAIIVLEPGQKFDPKTDHVFVAGWDGADGNHIVINGDSTGGAPIEIAAGVPHRFRFVNIGAATRLFYAIHRDSAIVTWRQVAKDGADLPPALAVVGPSSRRLGVGEMFDAEFTAPSPGEYRFTVGPPNNREHYSRRIIVH
jgi:FtsP/CotA-like multicopper oxidase with cupredoxin domain